MYDALELPLHAAVMRADEDLLTGLLFTAAGQDRLAGKDGLPEGVTRTGLDATDEVC
jgi:hypothetical protein